jgi:hypothetical protein
VTTLAAFLLARIAEDETAARDRQSHQDNVYEAAGWWDCDRVLAECEAKRRLVEAISWESDQLANGWFVARRLLRLLALPYADHPDYRDEWRA